jgi:hypothetical protein
MAVSKYGWNTPPQPSRNYAYEVWLASAHGAPEKVIDKLRAEEAAEIAALRAADGTPPEPKPKRSKSKKSKYWLNQITPSMVERARRKPEPSTVHRAELLHGSGQPPTVDTSGATDYGELVEKGFKK